MNPSSGEVPKFEVPVIDVGHEQDGSSESLEKAPAPEVSPSARTSSTLTPVQASPIAINPQVAVPTGYQKSLSSDDSAVKSTAADADRIEKEWIDKAKAIVAKTQDDPREQNSEMGKVKADYIKSRFNKTIPTDDAVTV